MASHGGPQRETTPLPRSGRVRIDADRMRRLFDSGIVGLVSWDRAGAIHDANDMFLGLFGRSRAEMESNELHWRELAGDRWDADEADTLAHAREPIDREYQRPDGTRICVRMRSASVAEDGDHVLSVVADISAQKRVERERDNLLDAERRALAEAEAAVRAREEILAIVSHDLRNPLNSISIGARLLESADDLASVRAQAGILQRAVGRMNRLIEDLLDVSRITSGRLEVEPSPICLATVLEDSCGLQRPQAAEKQQQFDCELPDRDLLVFADASRVTQVLANLLGNAIKFTPEGGRISVGANELGDNAVVRVEDSGQGIDAQDLPHVFDRFWQARRVRRGGVGLGLPIAQGIVEAHGGRIWVESSPGVGTAFSFTLPLSRSRAQPV